MGEAGGRGPFQTRVLQLRAPRPLPGRSMRQLFRAVKPHQLSGFYVSEPSLALAKLNENGNKNRRHASPGTRGL